MTIRLPGINIQQPWSQLLLGGDKIVETRTYPLPKKYIGKPFWLIETPGKDRSRVAMVVGVIAFGASIEYRNKKHFVADFNRHLVPVDHPSFGFRSDRSKYAWEVSKVMMIRPFEPCVRRGIIYTKPFEGPMSAQLERDVERICL